MNKIIKYNFYWLLGHVFYKTKYQIMIGKKLEGIHTEILNEYEANEKTILEITEVNINEKVRQIKLLLLNKPFVIRNKIDEKLREKWTLDFFKENFGEQPQPAYENSTQSSKVKYKKLSEIIENIQNNDKDNNLLFGNLIFKNKSLKNDLKNIFVKKFLFYKIALLKVDHLFLSAKNTHTQAHTEFGDNVFLQVSGKKKWYIYSPKFAPIFLPMIQRRFYFQASPKYGELTKNEKLLKVPHYEITLNSGDILYNPCLHWHFVETEETSISASCRWTNILKCFKYPFLTFLLITATNPTVFYQLLNAENTNPVDRY